MGQDDEARARARAAIEMGWMPARRPDHLWGGRASRGHCAACRSPMNMGEVALEMQFVEEGGARTITHDVHIRCYVALEDEWNLREAVGFTKHSTGPAASSNLDGSGS